MFEVHYLDTESWHDSWFVVDYTAMNITYPRGPDNETEIIVIMSDGVANRQCGEQGTGNSTQDAINSACFVQQNHNITVYTVGFGSGADNATLNETAQCGGGEYFYADSTHLPRKHFKSPEKHVFILNLISAHSKVEKNIRHSRDPFA